MKGLPLACVAIVAILEPGFAVPGISAENTPAADQAWQVILEQAGGPGTQFQSGAEAIAAARKHLEKQEAALRDFEARYPADGRHYSAKIRLSSVLGAKAKLFHQPAFHDEAATILQTLLDDPATPVPVKGDASFARLSQEMEAKAGHPDTETREGLMRDIRAFDASFPRDRRTPGLLAEIATLYDAEPAQKRVLLNEAQAGATEESLRSRIHDDLKRLDLLDRPLELRLQPWQGGPAYDLAAHRGRAVVVLFWASWSGPGLRELAVLMQTAHHYAGKPVDFVAVSLDEDRAALAAMIKEADLHWVVSCDFLGWKGETVQSLGVNALPTVFVVDRSGDLIALNAHGTAEDEIDRALKP